MSQRRAQQPPQRRPQRAVRVAQFEKSLENFNVEQGQKVALTIGQYHNELVEPRLKEIEEHVEEGDIFMAELSARLKALERSPREKASDWFADTWFALMLRFGRKRSRRVG